MRIANDSATMAAFGFGKDREAEADAAIIGGHEPCGCRWRVVPDPFDDRHLRLPVTAETERASPLTCGAEDD
ncbi:MAG: hypothetical protein QM675_11730 [Protaetiibacter sp.]